jgi:hypothetical protein
LTELYVILHALTALPALKAALGQAPLRLWLIDRDIIQIIGACPGIL